MLDNKTEVLAEIMEKWTPEQMADKTGLTDYTSLTFTEAGEEEEGSSPTMIEADETIGKSISVEKERTRQKQGQGRLFSFDILKCQGQILK